MARSTKLTKATIIFLFFVPIVLCGIAIVQTFVLKSRQNALYNAQNTLSQTQKQKDTLQGIENYLKSEEYLEEYYKHQHGYGNNGDIEITTK